MGQLPQWNFSHDIACPLIPSVWRAILCRGMTPLPWQQDALRCHMIVHADLMVMASPKLSRCITYESTYESIAMRTGCYPASHDKSTIPPYWAYLENITKLRPWSACEGENYFQKPCTQGPSQEEENNVSASYLFSDVNILFGDVNIVDNVFALWLYNWPIV